MLANPSSPSLEPEEELAEGVDRWKGCHILEAPPRSSPAVGTQLLSHTKNLPLAVFPPTLPTSVHRKVQVLRYTHTHCSFSWLHTTTHSTESLMAPEGTWPVLPVDFSLAAALRWTLATGPTPGPVLDTVYRLPLQEHLAQIPRVGMSPDLTGVAWGRGTRRLCHW